MACRGCIDPSRSLYFETTPFYFPVSCLPVYDMCQSIPVQRTKEPLRICLLGVGDVRNVLFSTYKRYQLGERRPIEFYLNDKNPAIIARDILLLHIAGQAPFDGTTSIERYSDFFINVWAEMAISGDDKRRLNAILRELLVGFPGPGCRLLVPREKDLWNVKKIWALWLTNEESMASAESQRNHNNQQHIHKPYISMVKAQQQDSLTRLNAEVVAELRMRLHLGLCTDIAATPMMRGEVLEFFRHGSMMRLSDDLRFCFNPTIYDPESKEYPYYFTNPFLPFYYVHEDEDLRITSMQTLFGALISNVQRLLEVFAKQYTSKKLRCSFDIGYCNVYMAERVAPDISFDVIDTSNLVDHLGHMNVLLSCLPKLNSMEYESSLWIETLRAHKPFSKHEQYFDESLLVPYHILGTVLQARCVLPFESCLTFDQKWGIRCRYPIYTSLKLQWQLAFPDSTPMPVAINTAPPTEQDVFKTFIDDYVTDIFHAYTGKMPNFGYQLTFPPRYTLTISTLLHLLLRLSRMMQHPRELFGYLYAKVNAMTRVERRSIEDADPAVFGLDVQITAKCICPREFWPVQPLHPLFKSGSAKLGNYGCTLVHTKARAMNPFPIFGWLLVDHFSKEDLAELSVFAERPVYGTHLGPVNQWIKKNSERMQFVDNARIDFPSEEVLMTLPTTVFRDARYTILGVGIQDGSLVYEPIPIGKLKELASTPPPSFYPLHLKSVGLKLPTGGDVTATAVHEFHHHFELQVGTFTSLPSGTKTGLSGRGREVAVLLHIPTGQRKGKKKGAPKTILKGSFHLSCPILESPLLPPKIPYRGQRVLHIRAKKGGLGKSPATEFLDLDKLPPWQKNRALAVTQTMFSKEETEALSEAPKESLYGIDPYLDVRNTLAAVYDAFIDQEARESKDVLRLHRYTKKVFLFASGSKQGLIAYVPPLMTTKRGTPIMEMQYMLATHPPSADCKKLTDHILGLPDKHIISTSSTDDEIKMLQQLLEFNSQMIEISEPIRIGGVEVSRSFFYPLYPVEDRYTKKSKFGSASSEKAKVVPIAETVETSRKSAVRRPFCCTCLAQGKNLKRCSRCMRVWFCDEACLKAGWGAHRKQCKAVSGTDTENEPEL